MGFPSHLRSRRTIFAALVLGATGVLTGTLLTYPREPHCRGYPLSDWVKQLSERNEQDFGPGCRWDVAPEAISHMGTNCLPFLVKWVSYAGERTPIRDSVNWALKKCPPLAKIPGLENWAWFDTEDVRAEGSYIAFRFLGPPAAPAIPGLLRVAMQPGEIVHRYRAIEALGAIGQQALPALLHITTNQFAQDNLARIDEGMVRNQAAIAIGTLGPAARPAIPLLVRMLADDDQNAAAGAAEALGNIPLEPDQLSNVVLALAKACLGPGNMRQQMAIKALGEIGAAAHEAIPTLQVVGDGSPQNPDTFLTAYAADAIAKIQTASTTNSAAP